jgi:hypothetical protein
MNKYDKALSRLFSNLHIHSEYYLTDKCDDDYDLLFELIDKATPKKVLKRETNGKEIKIGNGTFKLATMWYCPSCKNWISPSTSVNNCGHCGQALDWSKEDE